jgi:ubiquitin-conjugating enzyme E2 variant
VPDLELGYLLAQILAGVLVADLVSGVVHWLEDAYGREDMPFIGPRVIEPNIRHHYSPLDFTKACYLKRNGPIFAIAAITGLIFASAGWLNPFTITLLLVGSQANETHRWAHMPSSAVPVVVRTLQKSGLLLSQRHHSKHHRPPFSERYCTVTNLVNPIADGLKLFVIIEQLIWGVTGVQRRQDTGQRPQTIPLSGTRG